MKTYFRVYVHDEINQSITLRIFVRAKIFGKTIVQKKERHVLLPIHFYQVVRVSGWLNNTEETLQNCCALLTFPNLFKIHFRVRRRT
jgi:hypothetical protein